MAGRHNADFPPSPAAQRTTSAEPRDRYPTPFDFILDLFRPEPTQADYTLWPPQRAAHPNTTAYTSAAVACPDETSARRHTHRATWWEPYRVERHERAGQWIGSTIVCAGRRWTR